MSNLFTTKFIYILLSWKEKPEYLTEYSFSTWVENKRILTFSGLKKKKKKNTIYFEQMVQKALFQTSKKILNIFFFLKSSTCGVRASRIRHHISKKT